MIRTEPFRDFLAAYRSDNPHVPAMSDQEIDDFLTMVETVRGIEPKAPGQGHHGKIFRRRYYSSIGQLITESRLKGIVGPDGSRRIKLLQDVRLHFSMDIADVVLGRLPSGKKFDTETAGSVVEQKRSLS
jgi:hypothetical protein